MRARLPTIMVLLTPAGTLLHMVSQTCLHPCLLHGAHACMHTRYHPSGTSQWTTPTPHPSAVHVARPAGPRSNCPAHAQTDSPTTSASRAPVAFSTIRWTASPALPARPRALLASAWTGSAQRRPTEHVRLWLRQLHALCVKPLRLIIVAFMHASVTLAGPWLVPGLSLAQLESTPARVSPDAPWL